MNIQPYINFSIRWFHSWCCHLDMQIQNYFRQKVAFISGDIHKHLTLSHLEWPKLYGVLAVLSAIGLHMILLQYA